MPTTLQVIKDMVATPTSDFGVKCSTNILDMAKKFGRFNHTDSDGEVKMLGLGKADSSDLKGFNFL